MVNLVQENHTIGYWKQGKSGKEKRFCILANFGLRLLKHVKAPAELPQHSGFVVEVTQRQRSRVGNADHPLFSVLKGCVSCHNKTTVI